MPDVTAYEAFRVTRDGPITRLTLSRPDKRNSMIPSFWTDLPNVIRALSDAGQTRVLIIDAEGPAFTAGMDIAVFTGDSGLGVEDAHAREGFLRVALRLQDSFTALEDARFPVIAAIQGACIGGGVDMVTACDLRFATADATFRIEEINIAMMADVGTLQRLPKLIPHGVARELAYTGASLSAERALKLGLLNDILADKAALDAHVTAIAQTIASKPPLAVAASKLALNHARDHGVAESLKYAMTLQAGVFNPADIGAAITARMNKENAAWPDLKAIDDAV